MDRRLHQRTDFEQLRNSTRQSLPEPNGFPGVVVPNQRGPPMRRQLIAVALSWLATPAFAQCDDKSQQNTADEAAVKGDLAAGSKCADAATVNRSEKALEDAAERARAKTDEQSGSVGQGEPKGAPSPAPFEQKPR
jgi:hypothetical protein